MNRQFDPEPIKAQIANLLEDRRRIDQAISALQEALANIEGLENQKQLRLTIPNAATGVTLHESVKRACLQMVDGITRQRVIEAIEKTNPFLKPKSASVAASLIKLTKGERPALSVAIEGRGRSPAFYSTEGTTVHKLSAEEAVNLMDEAATKGTGGWQSLWLALQRQFDKATGSICLTPELRAKMYHYYHSYGSGGWQGKVQKVFRRELPHLFGS
jgi:hypothetical protein